jgi:hypothetical protein
MGRLIACLVIILFVVWYTSWLLGLIVTVLAIAYLKEEKPWNAHGVQQRSRRARPKQRRSNTRSMHFGRSRKW